jgi:hypothetical protein
VTTINFQLLIHMCVSGMVRYLVLIYQLFGFALGDGPIFQVSGTGCSFMRVMLLAKICGSRSATQAKT